MTETLERPDSRAREAQRLLRAGMLLFLFALLVGLAVPRFSVPRLGLSAHLLGVMQGTFLLVAGSLWPKLKLTRAMSRAGSFLAVYGCIAAWTANVLGALWGAGNSMLPIAAGQARGNVVQERIIAAGLVTAAVSLITMAMIILWGLRGAPIGRTPLDER
jgi:hydroxylaminobenzene mutase